MTIFKKVKIKNFKSIKEMSFEFDHLNILIGMNGSGKSTILQAMDFVSQLMHGQISAWLVSRDWKPGDLNCKTVKENNIEVNVEVELLDGKTVNWIADFNRNNMRCTQERITIDNELVCIVKSRTVILISNPVNRNITDEFKINKIKHEHKLHAFFEYEGSILSILSLESLPFEYEFKDPLIEFRNFLRNIKSLELLAPHLMRKSTRSNEGEYIGIGGEKLSSFLSTLNESQKAKLIIFLREFYPNVIDFKIVNQRSGWKKLVIHESTSSIKIESEARHINDGLLRVLAILAQLQAVPSFLMLDEIENGVNQEIIEKLVSILLESNTQLLITTHSPLVLNYLPDEIAVKSINYVYKSLNGETQYTRFFEIPRIKEKLECMGVGDALLDTDLIALVNELNTVD